MGDFFLPQTDFCFDIQLKKQFSAFLVIKPFRFLTLIINLHKL